MMEITNEIKAKVFAQYLGQRILPNPKYQIPDYYKMYFDTHKKPGTYECKGSLITTGAERDLLILKPISEIADEDAIEVANIFYGRKTDHTNETLIAQGVDLVSFIINDDSIHNCNYNQNFLGIIFTIQFIQSRGYDIPQYLLGGKTLKEAGLGIYEEKTK